MYDGVCQPGFLYGFNVFWLSVPSRRHGLMLDRHRRPDGETEVLAWAEPGSPVRTAQLLI
jgi:hypothetical protein